MRLFSKSLISSNIQQWIIKKLDTRQESQSSVTGYDTYLTCITYGDSGNLAKFIGSGPRRIYTGTGYYSGNSVAYSYNGLKWYDIENGTQQGAFPYREAIWVNDQDKFYSISKTDNFVIFKSSDGYQWSYAYIPPSGSNFPRLESLAYGNQTFVGSCGSGKYCYSNDGENWSVVSNSAFKGGKIRYLNHLFITSGDEDGYITSYNGNTFSTHQPAEGYSWNSLTYGDGKYLLVGNSGYITTSANLTEWSTPQKITDADIYDVTFDHHKFCAVGYKKTGTDSYKGFIATSINGVDWTPKEDDPYCWNAVTCGNGYFTAVGSYKHTEYVPAFGDNFTFEEGVIARKLA